MIEIPTLDTLYLVNDNLILQRSYLTGVFLNLSSTATRYWIVNPFSNNNQQTIEYCPRAKYFNRKPIQKTESDLNTAAFLLSPTRGPAPGGSCVYMGNFQPC